MNALQMIRGDTRTFDFSDIEDPDGIAYVLAGATLRFTVDGLFTKTTSDFDIDESSGEILITLVPDDTEDAPDHRRSYRYELEITLADGTVNTARRGMFIITPDLDAV